MNDYMILKQIHRYKTKKHLGIGNISLHKTIQNINRSNTSVKGKNYEII